LPNTGYNTWDIPYKNASIEAFWSIDFTIGPYAYLNYKRELKFFFLYFKHHVSKDLLFIQVTEKIQNLFAKQKNIKWFTPKFNGTKQNL